ncbi:MAG TPA: zinc ribbon domain-containing protein [Gemmatimonadaceae bacterium]|jgi:hypothetical protein
MDALDRMYRHLVRTIRSRFPQYLSQPFDVAELNQSILPYRLHRRELGIESNEDYEITLTQLLSGERDYLIVDEHMRDALRSELAAVNPDPTAFKQFAGRTVALSPAALRSLEIGPGDRIDDEAPAETTASAPAPSVPAPIAPAPIAPAPIAPASHAPPVNAPTTTPTVVRPSGAALTPGSGAIVPQPGEQCRACDEVLPSGRPITFCPHCGQNVTTMNCPACGSELEVGWKFCPTCGRPASAS